MNFEDLSLAFGLGLLGSVHCLQMCGPIVLAYSLPLGRHRRPAQLAAHLSYTAGRIVTYGFLGFLAGVAGATIGQLGRMAGLRNGAAVVAGILMILAGLALSDWIPREWGLLEHWSLAAAIRRGIGGFMQSPSAGGKFAMGLLLGFLPCGLVYAALLKAMGTAGAFSGCLTMMSFGCGSVAPLTTIGMFSSSLARRLGPWARHLPAAGVLLAGAFILARGLMPQGASGHMHH